MSDVVFMGIWKIIPSFILFHNDTIFIKFKIAAIIGCWYFRWKFDSNKPENKFKYTHTDL